MIRAEVLRSPVIQDVAELVADGSPYESKFCAERFLKRIDLASMKIYDLFPLGHYSPYTCRCQKTAYSCTP